MKKIIETTESEGLESLLGEKIMVWCMNYIYHGTLVEVGKQDIKLSNAKVVYETGELCSKEIKDAQDLPSNLHIRIAAIESYYVKS